MKLWKDFGVTALFGVIVLVGTFTLLTLGVIKNVVDFDKLLALLGAWVSGIVTGYIVIKGRQ